MAEGQAGRGEMSLAQAKKLRSDMTDAERRLWYRLRGIDSADTSSSDRCLSGLMWPTSRVWDER